MMITTTDISNRKSAFVVLFTDGQAGIIDRFLARRRGLWNPYARMAGRPHGAWDELVFSLYAAGYRYAVARVTEMSALALTAQLYQFDRAMSQIDAEAQQWVIEEAAKRVSHDLDLALLEAKVVTKELGLDEKTQDVTARIEALEADDYALQTEQARLQATKDKMELRIRELETQLQLMDVEIAMAEADVLREELKRAGAEIDVVKTQIRGIQLQAAISRVALSMAQEEVRQSEISTSISETRVRIEKEDLVEEELEIEQQQYENIVEDTELRRELRELIRQYRDERNATLAAFLRELNDLYEREQGAKEDEARERGESQVETLRAQTNKVYAGNSASGADRASKIRVGETDVDRQVEEARAKDEVDDARVDAAETAAEAAINAAHTTANANVTSSLSHLIRKG